MRICVIGLGKLGLPVASAFKSQGFEVVGVDTDENLVQSLQSRTFQTDEPAVSLEGIDFITKVPPGCSAAFICVQTPSKPDGSFSDEYVQLAMSEVVMMHTPLAVIVSTLMPGQSRAISNMLPSHIGLCYSPTFIRLGSVVKDFLNPDVRIIGTTSMIAGSALELIYDVLPRAPVKYMSLESAEIAKLAINCFITTKIAYANQLQMLCEQTPNSDVDDVTEAMGMDYRIGKHYLKAGMPFGGPCFPRDTIALGTLIEDFYAGDFNQNHAEWLNKLIQNENKSTLILGSSYKIGSGVTAESPSSMIDGFYGLFKSSISDEVKDIKDYEVVVIATQDLRWLQGDYRDKIVFDPWGYFKEHGIVCKKLITPGRRR